MSIGDGMNDGHGRHTDSAAAYLLGALPELEAAAFERHVMGCADCRDQLELLRPAVEALPRAVEPLAPSPGLKRDLMRQVRGDLAPRPAAKAAARPGLLERLRSSAPRVGRIKPAMAWVSAAFLLGMGVVAGFGASNLVGSQPKIYAAHVSPTVAPQGSATLEADGDGSHGAVLSVAGMPTLPSSQADKSEVYQLWLVRGGRVAPGAIFSVGTDGSGYGTIPDSIRDVDKVLVTREPAGGAKAPSEDAVIDVDLTST